MASPTVCEKCSGTGYIVVERDGLSGAERCSCYAQRRAERVLASANIPPKFADAILENFILPEDNPTQRSALVEAFSPAKRYSWEFPDTKKPGLLFIGNPGTGKTHLSVGVMKHLISRGFEGLFYDYQQLLTDIQQSWSQQAGSDQQGVFKRVREVEVLLLDDLGARRALDWVEDVVTELITFRYNHRKPLIATTNLSEPAAEHEVVAGKTKGGVNRAGRTFAEIIGERSRSRLFEMCKIVKMTGIEDYRMRGTNRGYLR
ncbi:MAG: ATP-binding protein [Bryobacteraceae bacterium]|nr:ATP-binding protein [Bryobacteraceae bacterium]